jgi:hypothetical protein
MKSYYVKLSRGRLQVIVEHVYVHVVFFGIYRYCDESTNLEPSFGELWVPG